MTRDTKMVTERESVARERAAFVAGLEDASWRDPATKTLAMLRADADAAKRYPLPKVERPRVVRGGNDMNYEFRLMHGDIEERSLDGSEWRDAKGWRITSELVALWADLIANPTELVEEDAQIAR